MEPDDDTDEDTELAPTEPEPEVTKRYAGFFELLRACGIKGGTLEVVSERELLDSMPKTSDAPDVDWEEFV